MDILKPIESTNISVLGLYRFLWVTQKRLQMHLSKTVGDHRDIFRPPTLLMMVFKKMKKHYFWNQIF